MCWSFILIFKFILLHWNITAELSLPQKAQVLSLFHKQKLCETLVKFKCPIPFKLDGLALLLFLADTNNWSHVINLIWII